MKLAFAVLSYLLGSIPTGYLIVRAHDRRDIRDFGSRATGATNVLRVKGVKFALPVMALDILKGFLPAFLALRLFHDPFLAALSGFLAVLGHCFPFSIGFRGGKGVATSVGAFLVLAWPAVLLCLAVFGATLAASRFVSLSSMLAALSFPLFVGLIHGPSTVVWWGLATGALVVFRHKDNIGRLVAGNEPRVGEKQP